MVELISYWKSTFSPNVCVKCGNLNEKQKAFWKKLYFNGLGELRYRNNINISFEDFMKINADESSAMQPAELNAIEAIDYTGYIVTIGGDGDPNNADNTRAYFTWIPRYEYKPKTNFQEIQIRFISPTQTTANTSLGYKLPEAFTWNGTPQSGFWVSKYEVSQ